MFNTNHKPRYSNLGCYNCIFVPAYFCEHSLVEFTTKHSSKFGAFFTPNFISNQLSFVGTKVPSVHHCMLPEVQKLFIAVEPSWSIVINEARDPKQCTATWLARGVPGLATSIIVKLM